MTERKPQINFQVEEPLKLLYDEAKESGHWVTRFCAAGLLLMVEDARVRRRAINRLRDWEAEYADATPRQIRDFVQGAQEAMQRVRRGAARGTRPARKAPRGRKKAKRG
jgi:hypothetical protein